jgi:hypothetical protein
MVTAPVESDAYQGPPAAYQQALATQLAPTKTRVKPPMSVPPGTPSAPDAAPETYTTGQGMDESGSGLQGPKPDENAAVGLAPTGDATTPQNPASAATTPAASGTPGVMGGPSGTTPGAPQTVQGAFQSSLMQLLNGPSPQEAGQNVMSSPAVTGYNLARSKQEERDRALMAERGAAGGYSSSGGMNTGILGLRQAAGSDMAKFAGEQAGIAEQGRRQELMQALALAQQMGDSESARQIQLQIAQMGNAFNYDQLGFNVANQEAYWNQQALQSLLGGTGAA